MKGKKQKEPVGFNPAEIFAALALLEKERGIPQSFMMEKIVQALTTAYKRDHADVENVIVDVDDARGNTLAQALGVLYVRCDVGDKAQVDALVAQVLAAYGRIDVLVNNAGIFRAADFLDVTEADFDAVLRVNLKGSFLVAQAVAREIADKLDKHLGK